MYENRIKKLSEKLEDNSALLITSDVSRFYLTGFKSSAGNIIITKTDAVFFIDFRYFEKAKSSVCIDVLLSKGRITDIKDFCSDKKIDKIYVETSYIGLSDFLLLREKLENIEFPFDKTFDKMLLDMRTVKTENELSYIRQAQKLTDETFTYILGNIKEGMTEKQVALNMEFYIRKLGSEGAAFDFIAVSGKNSSLPHGVPTDKMLCRGDFLTMDFGAVVNGYRSDMTRTVAIGTVSDEQRLVYDTVLKAQLEALKAIKSGVICSDADKLARDIIYSAGFEGCFGHALGHSVGIEIHESPALSANCKEILKKGTVMTVEPGIYIENKFGVRIEDMVFVTENGCENITKSDKNLIVV